MKFSLEKITLSFVLLVVGTQAFLPIDHNIHNREIQVPHPRLRRVYLDKLEPATTEQPVEAITTTTVQPVETITNIVDDDYKTEDISDVQPVKENSEEESTTTASDRRRLRRNSYEVKAEKPIISQGSVSEAPLEYLNPDVTEGTISSVDLETTTPKSEIGEPFEYSDNVLTEPKNRRRRHSYKENIKSDVETSKESDVGDNVETDIKGNLEENPIENNNDNDVKENTVQKPIDSEDEELSEKTEDDDIDENENHLHKRHTYGNMKKSEQYDEKLDESLLKSITTLSPEAVEETSTIILKGSTEKMEDSDSKEADTKDEKITESDINEDERTKRNVYDDMKNKKVDTNEINMEIENETSDYGKQELEETTTIEPIVKLSTQNELEEITYESSTLSSTLPIE